VRILVADDHDIFRRGLRQLLTARRGWDVCAEARNGREAVSLAERHKPDVVVMDISMPDLNGLEAMVQIKKELSKTEFVILTLHISDKLVHEIRRAGARAYVLKSDADQDLLTAVEAVSNRRTFFTAKAGNIILSRCSARNDEPPDTKGGSSRLTRREREVVQLIAEGRSSKGVGEKLGVSVKTAETHRANIMRKLDIHSVSELVRYAVNNQIIEA
jgi:DNA-binding NarL/FixJ family response regulator